MEDNTKILWKIYIMGIKEQRTKINKDFFLYTFFAQYHGKCLKDESFKLTKLLSSYIPLGPSYLKRSVGSIQDNIIIKMGQL